MRIPETGTYVYNENLKLKVVEEEWGADSKPSRQPDCVCLDAEQIKFPLKLRTIEQGDRFVPFGMNGMKLVSDYLTDRKKNLFQKRAQLVVEDAEGRICWLVKERADNRFRITKDTKKVIRMVLVESHV
jgi:tRNA(Ile)-lysidine synthase